MNAQFTIAVFILAVLSKRADQGAVTSQELADGFGTHAVVIRRVLARLAKAGLVKSQSGAGGGSILARPAQDITLRETYLAVDDGQERFTVRRRGTCKDNVDLVPFIADQLNDLAEEAHHTWLNSLGTQSITDFSNALGTKINATLPSKPE